MPVVRDARAATEAVVAVPVGTPTLELPTLECPSGTAIAGIYGEMEVSGALPRLQRAGIICRQSKCLRPSPATTG